MAPEARFERVMEAAASIVDSIEFRARCWRRSADGEIARKERPDDG
jgi:hypothetical protein